MSTNLNLCTHPDFGNLRTIVDGEQIFVCSGRRHSPGRGKHE